MNQRVRKHSNLDHVPAAGATDADTPSIGELCDLLIVEPEFINAVGAVKESNARGLRHRIPSWRGETGNFILAEIACLRSWRLIAVKGKRGHLAISRE